MGELESAIMEAMWAADRPYTVRDVRERMCYDRALAYTTVMTVMGILVRKGMLTREKAGRAWQYRTAESREDYYARLMIEVLHAAGDRPATMRRFLEAVGEDGGTSAGAALAGSACAPATAPPR